MARKLRVEVEGGLYHVIARGNDRQDIFHSPDDYLKFLALLAKQKARSPFFIYAFCMMTITSTCCLNASETRSAT